MTVDQNVSFYEEQIQLFTAVYKNAVHATETGRERGSGTSVAGERSS